LQEGVRDAIFARLDAAESAVDGAARQFPLAVLNPAGPLNQALNKTAGRTEKLLILAALGSFIAICTLLIGLDSIDRRLRTVGQAQLQLPTRLLAAIPQQAPGKGYIEIARMTELQPRSLASESYRFLGLHLLSQHNPEIRSLMVLAAKAEQGSTTTITNLGITLAQAGKRVIIVDANIRTTELHKVFELPNLHGYTDLLRDPTEETLAQAMQATSTPGLMVITCGIVPDNPWQLFRSENIRHASALMHRHADFVLYDTPSSLIFTDALNLAPVVDSAILCVRAQEALTGTEERLIQLLEEANVRVIGSVLHDVPVNQMEGYQNYQLYYRPIEGPTNVGMIEPPKSALPGPAGVGSGRNGSDNGHG
jgi:capsular exopolysaccharide synthesis family protein